MTLESGKEMVFPNLSRPGYSVTSPESSLYNCVAWAAGDSTDWWWPDANSYWPEGVERAETLDNFRAAFESLGYSECAASELETGFDKVAIFADSDGLPTHVARQLEDGRWTSKLGRWQDIEHASLRALENAPLMDSLYGTVALLMRRPSAGAGK